MTTIETCPCGSGTEYSKCCGRFLESAESPATAEELMRSRYSAFVKHHIQYLLDTVHRDQVENHSEEAIRDWSEGSDWLGLSIVDTAEGSTDDDQGIVEFIAEFREKGVYKKHHERASFKKSDQKWYFYDGEIQKQGQVKREGAKVGRNDPCPCGSGKKFKKCCGKN